MIVMSNAKYNDLQLDRVNMAGLAETRAELIKEKDKLIDHQRGRIDQLEESLTSCETALNEKRAEVLTIMQQHCDEVALWESDNRKLSELLEAEKAKVADLEIRLKSACEAMTANEERAQELQARDTRNTEWIRELQEENRELTADRDRFLRERNEMTSQYRECVVRADGLAETVRVLQSTNRELVETVTRYESETSKDRNLYQHKAEELDLLLGRVQTDRDIAENNVVVLERRLKEVSAERDEAEKAVKDMEARFADRREKHTIEVNALVAERNQAKEAMEGAMSDAATWKRRFEDASHLTEGWHQEACDLRGQLAGQEKAYKDAVKDLEHFRAKCADLTEHLKEVEAYLKETTEERDRARAECEDLLKHVEEGGSVPIEVMGRVRSIANATHDENKALRAKCEALAEKLMAVEAERDLLRGDLQATVAECVAGAEAEAKAAGKPMPSGIAGRLAYQTVEFATALILQKLREEVYGEPG